MAWSALVLRCLLVLAFCLDGGVSLWKASTMASRMAGEALAGTTVAEAGARHHDLAPSQASGGNCETKGTFLPDNVGHDDCNCDTDGSCNCPCAFAVKLLAHEVPFAAQHRVPAQPAEPLQEAVAQAQTTSVFRPPIA